MTNGLLVFKSVRHLQTISNARARDMFPFLRLPPLRSAVEWNLLQLYCRSRKQMLQLWSLANPCRHAICILPRQGKDLLRQGKDLHVFVILEYKRLPNSAKTECYPQLLVANLEDLETAEFVALLNFRIAKIQICTCWGMGTRLEHQS